MVFLKHPLAEVDKPPAHDAMNGRDRAAASKSSRSGIGIANSMVRGIESNHSRFGNPSRIRINESWYKPPTMNRHRGIAHRRSNGLARRLPPDLTPARGLWRDLRDTLIARDHRAILIVLSAVASAEKLTGRRVSSVI
jgi:hypothetical protein